MERPNAQSTRGTTWPYASLLFVGFFGVRTPEGRRLAWRTTAALAAIVVAFMGLGGAFGAWVPRPVWALLIPASVCGIAWAYTRYLRELDELSRLIQLRAFSFAYAAAMVLFAAVVAFGAVQAEPGEPVSSGPVLWILLAEVLRGVALAYIARQYE